MFEINCPLEFFLIRYLRMQFSFQFTNHVKFHESKFQKSERPLGSYLKLRPDGSKIVGHDERSCEDRPNGHLNFRLVQTQAIVSNDQLKHWITVPCMNTRRKMFRIHILQNELHIMSPYFWLGFLLYIFLGILQYLCAPLRVLQFGIFNVIFVFQFSHRFTN